MRAVSEPDGPADAGFAGYSRLLKATRADVRLYHAKVMGSRIVSLDAFLE